MIFVLLFNSRDRSSSRLKIVFLALVSVVSLAILIVETRPQFKNTRDKIEQIN